MISSRVTPLLRAPRTWSFTSCGRYNAVRNARFSKLRDLRGAATVDLETKAPASAAGAALAYLALLERADELCRAGLLLTPEPPAEVKDLRRWFVEEMVAQLQPAG